MRLFIAAVAAAALSGCATEIMSEKQCLAGDWRAAAFEDGPEGRLEPALDERAARCAQFGAAVDDRAYFDGRRAGLGQRQQPMVAFLLIAGYITNGIRLTAGKFRNAILLHYMAGCC